MSWAKASIDSGMDKSTGTKRTAAPAPLSSCAVSSPRSTRISPMTSRAPCRAHASAIALPTPRAAPVTTIVRPARVAAVMRLFGNGADAALRFRLGAKIAPQPRDACVVLIEILRTGPRRHVVERLAILLENFPGPWVVDRVVHEAEQIGMPAGDFPQPPEGNLANLLVDRHHRRNHPQRAARPKARRQGNSDAHEKRACIDELHRLDIAGIVPPRDQKSGRGRLHIDE